MEIKKIEGDFTVCKVVDYSQVDFEAKYCFMARTDEEKSLVCLVEDVPDNAIEREDGWKAFYIVGTLEFSMIGILSNISTLLADENISVFAISTFNTDYFLVKKDDEMKALSRLARAGYKVLTGDAYGDYFFNRSVKDIMAEYSEQHDEWVSVDLKNNK